MTSKKVSQSKEQPLQPLVKLDPQLVMSENSDPVAMAMSIVDKKVRNLDKRKSRLLTLKEKMNTGEQLDRDQKEAITKLESVDEQLELMKDIQKQFTSVGTEHSKLKKRQQRQEKVQQREQQREIEKTAISGALRLQLVLNALDDTAKEDFQNGTNGAMQLNELELEQLDDWYQLINPTRVGSDNYDQDIQEASEHILLYLEDSTKTVNETTYEDLHKLVAKVDGSGYFDVPRVSSDLESVEEETKEGYEEDEDREGDESSQEDYEPDTNVQALTAASQTGIRTQLRESPQPTSSVPTHVPSAVQPQGMVPVHVTYLPGTPSPTFPGLQTGALQTEDTEGQNFQIDFLHDSDLRDQEQTSNGSYSAVHPQPNHKEYNYSSVTMNTAHVSSVDSGIPPIVSPTGEVIQPRPLSYKQTLSSGHVTSHSPDQAGLGSTGLGSTGQDSYQSSNSLFISSKGLGSDGSGNRNYTSNNNNGTYRGARGGRGGAARNSGHMVGAPVIKPYQNEYRRGGNGGSGLSKSRGGTAYRSGGGVSRKT